MKLNNKVKLNTILGFAYQILVFVCGLILPRLILINYGSNVNGLVNSISNFLNIIAIMDMGVGAVTQTALYKPLANNDEEAISRICFAAKKFYKIVGLIFSFFAIGVGFALAFSNLDDFDFYYTFVLVISIGITYFAQYYFGIVNNLLLRADQKSYIIFIIQGSTLVLNTVACFVLIHFNVSIQIVKLTTSIIYLLRPIFYFLYIKRNYNIKSIKPQGNELPQKWNGMLQHFASFVLLNTDVIILTIFATLVDVSIYSVYYMIAKALADLITSLMGGIKSYYGRLIAIGNPNSLEKFFVKSTFFISSITTIVFGIAVATIMPFIQLYTRGVSDGDYYQPFFAIIMLVGKALWAFKSNLNNLAFAAGHYKETQSCAIIEMILNIVISIVLVYFFGLIGVAIGTLIAMIFSFIYYCIYIEKKFIKHTTLSIKQIIKFMIVMAFSCYILFFVKIEINEYIEWIIYALVISLIISVLYCGTCLLDFKTAKQSLKSFLKKDKNNEKHN